MLAQQLGELVGPGGPRLVQIDELGNKAPDVPGVEEERGRGLWP